METDELLTLPEPLATQTDPIYQVCDVCFNVRCNEELEAARKQRKDNKEMNADWVKRCNAISEKYGFGAEHKWCENCYRPMPHQPSCIACGDREDTKPEPDEDKIRFEHAIDILIEQKEVIRKRIHLPTPDYSSYIKDLLKTNNAEHQAQIDDIEDAINNLYAIREVCPNQN